MIPQLSNPKCARLKDLTYVYQGVLQRFIMVWGSTWLCCCFLNRLEQLLAAGDTFLEEALHGKAGTALRICGMGATHVRAGILRKTRVEENLKNPSAAEETSKKQSSRKKKPTREKFRERSPYG